MCIAGLGHWWPGRRVARLRTDEVRVGCRRPAAVDDAPAGYEDAAVGQCRRGVSRARGDVLERDSRPQGGGCGGGGGRGVGRRRQLVSRARRQQENAHKRDRSRCPCAHKAVDYTARPIRKSVERDARRSEPDRRELGSSAENPSGRSAEMRTTRERPVNRSGRRPLARPRKCVDGRRSGGDRGEGGWNRERSRPLVLSMDEGSY